jgi:hypothetical protein
MASSIVDQAYAVFHDHSIEFPPMSLRAGNAIDSYEMPPAYDEVLDKPTDDYLQKFAYFALSYLDAVSWRYYLPILIDYALRHVTDAPPETALVVEVSIWTLRPPDLENPRLSLLNPEQKLVIIEFLEFLAFNSRSMYQNDALQALEEYWL